MTALSSMCRPVRAADEREGLEGEAAGCRVTHPVQKSKNESEANKRRMVRNHPKINLWKFMARYFANASTLDCRAMTSWERRSSI